MVMSRKKCPCKNNIRISDKFKNCPRDGQTIISACSASDLIQKKQASSCSISQYCRYFIHFNHECRLSRSKIIRCANPCKNAVNNSNMCTGSRYKASHLSKKYNESHLTHVG